MEALSTHTAQDYASFPLNSFPYTIGPHTSHILSLLRRLDDKSVIIAGSSALAVLVEHLGHKVDFGVEDVDMFCLKDKDQFKRVALEYVSLGLCSNLKCLVEKGCIFQGEIYEKPIQFIGFEKEKGGDWLSLLNHFDIRVCKVAIVYQEDRWVIRAAPGVVYDIHRKATEIVLPSPAAYAKFIKTFGPMSDQIEAYYKRGETRRQRYIEKGFQVFYFDEGNSYKQTHDYPVEVWLGEIVFNRLFTVPRSYLLGGERATEKNLAKANKIMTHMKDVLHSYVFEEGVDEKLTYECGFEPEPVLVNYVPGEPLSPIYEPSISIPDPYDPSLSPHYIPDVPYAPQIHDEPLESSSSDHEPSCDEDSSSDEESSFKEKSKKRRHGRS